MTCSNATFRRKMKVTRCKELFTLEITLEDLTLTQTTVTVFSPVIKKVFSGPEEDMKEFFLSLERYDFIVNKKRIVEDINTLFIFFRLSYMDSIFSLCDSCSILYIFLKNVTFPTFVNFGLFQVTIYNSSRSNVNRPKVL